MPGPPRKPTALRALQGNPAKRPLPPNEPTAALADAESPAELEGAAQRIWQEIAPVLIASRILTQLDRLELAKACRFQALCNRFLTLAEASTSKKRPPAAVLPALRLGERASSLFAKFGMTPADRAKLSAAPPNGDQDPLEAYKQAKPTRKSA